MQVVQTANTYCDGVWQLLKERIAHTLFTLSNGYQLPSLNGSFRRLMRDTGLEKDAEGQHALCIHCGTLMIN
jgi:hypothetical protein